MTQDFFINGHRLYYDDLVRYDYDDDKSDAILDDVRQKIDRAIERANKPPRKKVGDGVRPPPNPQSVEEDDDTFTRVENVVAKCTGLSLGATALYVYIASFCHGDKTTCFPGLDCISLRFSITKTTAEKYIKELVEWKMIEVIRRGKMKSNLYRLLHR